MHPHLPEDQRPDTEQADRKDPEISRRIEMLPKPLFLINRASVSVHNIYERIQLEKHLHIICLKHRNAPQNWGRPHTDLQSDRNDLLQIPDKHYQRTSQIAHAQHQQKHAEAVIDQLQRIQVRIITISYGHTHKHHHEENMDESCRYHLDDRQDTDIEHYLFDQIIIFEQCHGTLRDRLRKIEPWYQASRQIQNIRHFQTACHHLTSRIKHFVENDPVHYNRHDGLRRRPDNAQIRPGITILKIILRQLPDHLPALKKFCRNGQDPLIKNRKNNTGKRDQHTPTDFLHLLRHLVCQRIMMPDQHCSQKQAKPPENGNPYGLSGCSYFLDRMIDILCLFHVPYSLLLICNSSALIIH